MLLIAVSCNSSVLSGQLKKIPVATDFSALARQAEQQQLPILLVVSQEHCPYCDLLKLEVLNPMMISGNYTGKVIMTELLIDVGDSVRDFDGKPVYPGKIAADYKTWVTPTLLFLDYQGKEVHQRMLGVNTIEMYGFYLDESIDAALDAVRKGEPYAYRPAREKQKAQVAD